MGMRKLDKKDFEIGQTVALRYQGNLARGKEKGENSYRLGVVEKIGRTLITVDGIQFRMESSYEKTDYSPNYQLYESEELIIEQLEREEIHSRLKSAFGSYLGNDSTEFTLEQLRKVQDILNL